MLVLELVMEIRKEMPRIGTRKLYHLLVPELRSHHIKLGRDKLFALLREENMLVRPKRKYTRTTDSKHWLKVYPNLTKELKVNAPHQLWVSDITYLRTGTGFCYLSLVTDAYSRKIVGYHLSQKLEAKGCLSALRMALTQYAGHPKLIHHSDRGVQYCSGKYMDILRGAGIEISMAAKGDPYENAIAERVNGILKTELGLGESFKSYHHAIAPVVKAVNTYNTKRPHASCDYLTPEQAHSQSGELKKRWKRKNHEQQVSATASLPDRPGLL